MVVISIEHPFNLWRSVYWSGIISFSR